MPVTDILTQQQAHIIAFDYNFAPLDKLKTERVIGSDGINSVWLATRSRAARCFAIYQQDVIAAKRVEGDPCTACWSEGKLWSDEPVPKYVFCSLSFFSPPVEFLNTVFEPGEPIKIGVYMLTQENAPDCTYEYLDDTKEIIWTPDDVLSTLIVKTKPDNIVRMDSSCAGCFKLFKEDSHLAEIRCC